MSDNERTFDDKISLSGFRNVDPASMNEIKKKIGVYSKRFANKCEHFELLKISMKNVHELEHSEKYEIHTMVIDGGSRHTSSITERNLFTALDKALKKVENIINK